MVALFRNELHNDFVWALGYIPFGGADFGEIQAVAEVIGDGDDSVFHDAWVTAGGRLKAAADASLAKSMLPARERFACQRFLRFVLPPIVWCAS